MSNTQPYPEPATRPLGDAIRSMRKALQSHSEWLQGLADEKFTEKQKLETFQRLNGLIQEMMELQAAAYEAASPRTIFLDAPVKYEPGASVSLGRPLKEARLLAEECADLAEAAAAKEDAE